MHTTNPPAFRDRDDVAAFLDGLDLVEPGLVRVPEWRSERRADTARTTPVLAAVARKR